MQTTLLTRAWRTTTAGSLKNIAVDFCTFWITVKTMRAKGVGSDFARVWFVLCSRSSFRGFSCSHHGLHDVKIKPPQKNEEHSYIIRTKAFNNRTNRNPIRVGSETSSWTCICEMEASRWTCNAPTRVKKIFIPPCSTTRVGVAYYVVVVGPLSSK